MCSGFSYFERTVESRCLCRRLIGAPLPVPRPSTFAQDQPDFVLLHSIVFFPNRMTFHSGQGSMRCVLVQGRIQQVVMAGSGLPFHEHDEPDAAATARERRQQDQGEIVVARLGATFIRCHAEHDGLYTSKLVLSAPPSRLMCHVRTFRPNIMAVCSRQASITGFGPS